MDWTNKIIKCLTDNNCVLQEGTKQKLQLFNNSIFNKYPFNQVKASKFGSPSKMLYGIIERFFQCHGSTNNLNITRKSKWVSYNVKKYAYRFETTYTRDVLTKDCPLDVCYSYAVQITKELSKQLNGQLTAGGRNALDEIVLYYINQPALNHAAKYQLIAYTYIIMTRARVKEDKIKYEKLKNKNKKLESDCSCLYEFLKTKEDDDVSSETRIYTNFSREHVKEITECYNANKKTKAFMLCSNMPANKDLTEKAANVYFFRYMHNFPLSQWTEFDEKEVEKIIKKLGYSMVNGISVKDVIAVYKDDESKNDKIEKKKNIKQKLTEANMLIDGEDEDI